MLYEVRVRLFFEDEDEARDFYHDCELAYHKGVVVRPDEAQEERPFTHLLANYHDEDPLQPCQVLESL